MNLSEKELAQLRSYGCELCVNFGGFGHACRITRYNKETNYSAPKKECVNGDQWELDKNLDDKVILNLLD